MTKSGSQVGDRMPTDSDQLWTAQIEAALRVHVPTGEDITLEAFKLVIAAKDDRLAKRFFEIFDEDGSGKISRDELMSGLKTLVRGSTEQKLKFMFQVYDLDGDGNMNAEEFRSIIRASVAESKLEISEEELETLAMQLMKALDKDESGLVTFEEVLQYSKENPETFAKFNISVASCLEPPKPKTVNRKKARRKVDMGVWFRNNAKLIFYLVVFFLINGGLFAISAYQYRESNVFVIIARGCGMALNFDCAYILVLVLRYFLTWLRQTWVGANLLPLDQHIMLHKLTAWTILFFTVIHTAMHFSNYNELTKTTNFTYFEYALTAKPGIGYVYGSAPITGLLLVLVMVVLYSLSQSCVRRSGHFEVFYIGHHIFIAFFILLILHGPRFGYFLILPMLMYIVERIFRTPYFNRRKYGRIYVKEGILLPSKVTHLVIKRPKSFLFRPGDYVFIQIPSISKAEWHPFTISSAPEMKEDLWLHIRAAGHWTEQLHKYFTQINDRKKKQASFEGEDSDDEGSKELWNTTRDRLAPHAAFQDNMTGRLNRYMATMKSASHLDFQAESAVSKLSIRKRQGKLGPVPEPTDAKGAQGETAKQKTGAKKQSDEKQGKKSDTPVSRDVEQGIPLDGTTIYLDGPYGAPAEDIFHSEHAVLISTGIGVTPFASILQSLMYRFRAVHHRCPSCKHHWSSDDADNAMTLKKVDMIWVNREQKSFEWFVGLLRELELDQLDFLEEGEDRRLDFHLYLTSALKESDMKSFGLQMALNLHHKLGGRDVITGLKSRTYMGRPNWVETFQKLKDENRGKITVFFCGAPALAKMLKKHADEFGFDFKKEEF